MNSDPMLGKDYTFKDPSNWEIIALEITRPNPIPEVFLYYYSFVKPNNLKSLSISSYCIPTPESLIDILR